MKAIALYQGRVVGVDENNYMIDVELANGMNLRQIQIATNFFNPKYSSGIVGLPDLDSLCLVAELDNGEFIIIGFIAPFDKKRDGSDSPIQNEVGFRNNRPKWKKGDFGFSAPGAGFVKSESSGLVHLMAGYLSQIYLIPDPLSMIKMLTDNFELEVGYNKISLENDRVQDKTNFTFKIRPKANSHEATDTDIEFQIGKTGDLIKITVGGDTVFHISSDKKHTTTINNNLMVIK